MRIYDAKIYLKDNIRKEDCVQMFEKWIKGSKQYPCQDLFVPKNQYDDFTYEKENVHFSVKYYEDDMVSITACRFENDDTNGKWTVSVIFFKERNEKPYILVQLEYDGDQRLPSYNRPYIVKLVLEQGWIDSEKYLSFSHQRYGCGDKHYFTATEKDLDKLAEIITAKREYDLPLVYISYDHERKKYPLTDSQLEKLALELMGTAYVVKDPTDSRVRDKLSLRCKTWKVFKGRVGVYYPGIPDYVIYRWNYHLINLIKRDLWTTFEKKHTTREITWKTLVQVCDDTQLLESYNEEIRQVKMRLQEREKLLAFYQDSESHTILCSSGSNYEELLQERELVLKILERGLGWYESESRGRHLLQYVLNENKLMQCEKRIWENVDGRHVDKLNLDKTFEEIARKGDEILASVKKDMLKAEIQLSKYDGYVYLLKKPKNTEFFDGEVHDLVVTCLLEMKRLDEDFAPIVDKLLERNRFVGVGKKLMDEIREILSKEERVSVLKPLLEQKGFVFESSRSGGHHKGYFENSHYPIVLSNSPSDHRTSKNTASDILKKISIYK